MAVYPGPFSSTVDGTVPASGGGTTNFLRADGSWAAPPAAGGGITDLTGDVTTPDGGGIVAATIANDAVTYAKMQNVSAASKLLGRGSAGGAGDVEEITVGSGLTMTGTTLSSSGSSDFTTTATKGSDQDVTNSTTLVDDTALTIAVLAGEVWYFEAFIIYCSTDASRDFKWDYACSAGTMQCIVQYSIFSTADAPITTSVVAAAAADTTDVAVGAVASAGIRMMRMTITAVFSNNCNFKFRFAQNSASVGTFARCKAGSILRGKKIA